MLSVPRLLHHLVQLVCILLALLGNTVRFLALIMASATPFCFWTTQKHLTVKRAMSSRT